MSEKHLIPAGPGVFLAAAGAGAALTALLLLGLANLMAARGLSASMAGPLAAGAVCFGSFCSGFLAAFFKRERGLLTGLVQGAAFVAVLLALMALRGSVPGTEHGLRFAAILACSGCGGLLGMLKKEQRRHRRT